MNLSIFTDKCSAALNYSLSLDFSIETVFTGVIAVLAILGLLYAVLSVFKLVFAQKTAAPGEKAPVVSSPSVPTPTTAESEIVAVIAAAIAMAESESDSGMKFRVVSFRRR